MKKFWFAGLFFLTTIIFAYANQPPGPFLALPVVSVIPMVIILTWIGGGFIIIKENREKKSTFAKYSDSVIASVGFVFLFFGAIAFEGMALIALFVFSIFALYRGGAMISWGIREKNANPNRLVITGILIIIFTLFFVYMGYSFAVFYSGGFFEKEEPTIFKFENLASWESAVVEYNKNIPEENRIKLLNKTTTSGA
ncbi:MAG: hypothetical protein PHV06_06480, partial [bacterium]|nr:hypothetical protein [bacterium]